MPELNPPSALIDSINASQVEKAENAPDARAQLEEVSYKADRQKLLLKELGQNIEERRRYAGRIFWLSVVWVCGIFLILIADGIGWHFHLADSVLLMAIGSTTTNILGIFYIVVRYLFPLKPEPEPSTETPE